MRMCTRVGMFVRGRGRVCVRVRVVQARCVREDVQRGVEAF